MAEMSVTEMMDIAANCDRTGRILEAEHYYERIVPKLVDEFLEKKSKNDKNAAYEPIRDCIERVELIRHHIENILVGGRLITNIQIKDGADCRGYTKLLSAYLNPNLKEMIFEEPQLYTEFQIVNLMKFLKVIPRRCLSLGFIKLLTIQSVDEPDKQNTWLSKLVNIMHKKFDITVRVMFEKEMKITRIILSNGYLITMSHGLHLLKKKKEDVNVATNNTSESKTESSVKDSLGLDIQNLFAAVKKREQNLQNANKNNKKLLDIKSICSFVTSPEKKISQKCLSTEIDVWICKHFSEVL